MVGSGPDILSYADRPATRASTWASDNNAGAVLTPAYPGNKFDICLPVSSDVAARRVVAELSGKWSDISKSSQYEFAMSVSKSTMAGELFVQQVEASGARFSQSMTQLAKDYHKVGKFTPDHVAKILDARLLLRKDLSSIYPIASFFRADMLDMSASNTATARLSTEIDSLKKLPPEAAKTISNLARNAAKRSLAAPSYIDEAPIVTDFRLAKKLKTVGNIVQVVEFLPPAAVLLTTDDNRERERALNELWAKGSGFAVEQMLVRFGPALCVAFGVSTAGWGFAACGIASVAAGIYFGKAVEVNMTKVFGPP